MGRSKGNSGSWLVTYSDMVTLLLVFFVVLYTMTPGIDQSQFDNFISYFQSSVGVIKNNSVVKQKSQDKDEYRKEIVEQWSVVEDFLQRQNLSSQVDIEQVAEGVKITLSDSLTFNSGSSDLLPNAERVLDEIAGVFTDEIVETEVQGHTDADPVASSSYYRSNWHLGAARGVSVLKYIQDRSGLEPERYKASSFGEYRPIAENTTLEGKRRNRRVEIYVKYKGLMSQDEFETPAVSGAESSGDVLAGKENN
ncbi:OmpA/MotB family protein [Rhodohalobacter sp. 8-1]|uniref:OmpA/MotB family protein n=1 Tax=Rhodohalobacter sp. 8-1 TaxID=3131972 RepID=UPI0030EF55C0